MQQPVSLPLQLVEHENLYPDLLHLEIQCEPVASSSLTTADVIQSGTEWFDVYLSVTVSSSWVSLAQGRVKVALTQADLILDLYEALFQAEPVSPTPSIRVQSVANSPVHYQLVPSSGSLLEGKLVRLKLGTLKFSPSCSRLVAMVVITPADLQIVEAEGLWRHDITPNKHGIVERYIALSLYRSRLSPYLAWVQFCATCPDPCPTHPLTTHPLDEAELHQVIQAVIDTPTNNLLKLAQTAELVVETDLAGISLRGGSLNGLDLSNVDLSRANLRGADLTDTELSEANLQSAKLGGADLSGADLGSINLKGADLHRASLALANLSGADLSGANLRETHLSQTNLNGVHVTGARFGNNSGLTPEDKATLQERGAIFEE